MNKKNNHMKLGAFLLNSGHHIAAWRHPNSRASERLDFNYYKNLAETAERGKFDMLFLSDFLGMPIPYSQNEDLAKWGNAARFEPLTLLSALATVTENIGLIATASTTYNEPFNIARKFASMDFLSSGRAGWNVVTSSTESEAKNNNLSMQLDHATRYRRASEFMQVVTKLWDSWEDDAFLFNKASGYNFDPAKLHTTNHVGEFFSVKGPLNIARPPQGYPIIVQAGSSEDGKAFGAQWAEVIFTAHQHLAQAQKFYSDIKNQACVYGRDPEHIKVMPGFMPIIGKTTKEAQDKYAALQDLIDERLGLGLLTGLLGEVMDFSTMPLDKKLPQLPVTNGNISRQQLIYLQSQQEGLTVRQLYKSIASARGHRVVCGSAIDIADELEEWFIQAGADGFNIMPAHLPGDLDEFVNLVIPELQKRNLFRQHYEGKTLRENLGLPRPENQLL